MTSLVAARYGGDRIVGHITVDLSSAAGKTGARSEDIVKEPANLWPGDERGSFSFWTLSLKGTDGAIDYGPIQAQTAYNEARTGTEISRLKVDTDGQIEFMPAKTGRWTRVQGDGQSLQFVIYYYQNTKVSDANPILNFHVSNPCTTVFAPPGDPLATGWGIIAEVIDRETGEQLAQSVTMYYFGVDVGVQNIALDVIDSEQYQVTGVDEFTAADQGQDAPWTSVEKADPSHPMASYDYEHARDGTMNAKWGGDNPHHLIFTAYVSRTTQVGLVKHLSGEGCERYKDNTFTFSAQVNVPAGNVLRGSYPASGLADGATEVIVTPDAADPASGTITGIAAKVDSPITISGFPIRTKIRFSETETPERDPSVFQTAFANDVTGATDGSAIAHEPNESGENRPQTVTATNTLSSAQGRVKLTKTFLGLKKLTSKQRIDLNESFSISASGSGMPTLATSNCTAVAPATGILDESADVATYTWELNRVETGAATLTETGYSVSSVTVSAQARVAGGPIVLSDSAAVTISTAAQTVEFTNEYGVAAADLAIAKVWVDTPETEQLPVTVELDWRGNAPGGQASGVLGPYTIDSAKDWKMTVPGLPTHTSATGDIVYSVRETAVGGRTPFDAGFDSDVTAAAANDFTITNSKMKLATLKIKKIDAAGGGALAGARIILTEADGSQIGDAAETGSDGVVAFGPLSRATYLYRETRAPAGYQLAPYPYKFTVDRAGLTLFAPDKDGAYPDEGAPIPLDTSDGAYHVTLSDQVNSPLPLTGEGRLARPPVAIAGAAATMLALAYLCARRMVRR